MAIQRLSARPLRRRPPYSPVGRDRAPSAHAVPGLHCDREPADDVAFALRWRERGLPGGASPETRAERGPRPLERTLGDRAASRGRAAIGCGWRWRDCGNDPLLRIYSDVAANKHKWDWAGLGAVAAAG